MAVRYPFTPKSTSYLEPGQFWGIPLSNGSFACGRVLQLNLENEKRHTRQFLAGLMNWCGNVPPDADSLAGADLLAHGSAHVKTVAESGGQILGHRPLGLDSLPIPLTLDQAPGTKNCRLRRGFEVLGIASSAQQRELAVFKGWGYNVVVILANKHFGGAV